MPRRYRRYSTLALVAALVPKAALRFLRRLARLACRARSRALERTRPIPCTLRPRADFPEQTHARAFQRNGTSNWISSCREKQPPSIEDARSAFPHQKQPCAFCVASRALRAGSDLERSSAHGQKPVAPGGFPGTNARASAPTKRNYRRALCSGKPPSCLQMPEAIS